MTFIRPWRDVYDIEITRPAMDLYETEKEFVVELIVPGFELEQIDLSIESEMLKVSGKAEEKKEEKEKGYFCKEIRIDSFKKNISLPADVNIKEIQAFYKKGILKIVIPKEKTTESSKTKFKINIKK